MTTLRERRHVYHAAFLRAVATGLLGVVLALYVLRLGFDAAVVGSVVSAGLLGAVAAASVVTFAGERLGRRRCQIAIASLGALGLAALSLAEGPVPLAIAACLGMVNGMGRDRGAALVLDQALLPGTTADASRTLVFARYHLLQDAGHALGGLCAGGVHLLQLAGVGELGALRAALWLAAAAFAATALSYARLGAVGHAASRSTARMTPATRRMLSRIVPLFALDSLGSGFLGAALLSVFFHRQFGAGEALLGVLFAIAGVANALSHLAAAWLAARIGLVNTMVFTHIPSSLLLVTVAFAPSFAVAAVLFLLREGLVEMDVPTRQSYVLAVVEPEERTFASGITNLVRLAAWAVAPAFAGVLMNGDSMYLPLVIGAGMKVSYDLLLWRAFRAVRPPEEARSA